MKTEVDTATQSFLLWLTHDAVEAHSQQQNPAPLSLAWETYSQSHQSHQYDQDLLEGNHGAFVSWYLHGNLQGCIGTFQRSNPLWKTIQQMAVYAATQDPRFTPVTSEQIPHLRAEISVLLPPVPISGPDEVLIGRDGLVVETTQHRGVLLPQVATQRGWNAEEFLEHTCIKARLPIDAWKQEDTMLHRFEAVVIEEGK